jgi:hypothetical protein
MSEFTDKQIADFQGQTTTVFTLHDPTPVQMLGTTAGAVLGFAVLVWAFQRWNLTQKINKVIDKIKD